MPHFRPSASVHARRFGEDLVLLDLEQGKYYSLDGVGVSIWETLAEGRDTDEAIAAVLRDYDIDEGTARADATRLVGELLSAGLLEERSV